jgi:hypothetical protein
MSAMRIGVLLALALPVFADVSLTASDLRDFYPTTPGTVWLYVTSDGIELESKAEGEQEFDGKKYLVLELARYFTKDHRSEYLTVTRDRIEVSVIGGAALSLGHIDPPMTLLQGPLRVGSRWSTKGIWVYVDSRCRYEMHVEGKVLARESIRVPAGTFSCWKVELSYTFGSKGCVFPYKRTLWLARGVGIVRQANEFENQNQGFIELKQYRPPRR